MTLKFLNSAYGSQKIDSNNIITLAAKEKTDFFVGYNVDTNEIERRRNAPFLFQDVTGNFVATVKVSVDFKYTYDSGVLMVMDNENLWSKLCFEETDFGTLAIVSVVTERFSDDANGVNIENNFVYLKAVRVGNNLSFHYSLDGKLYNMVRFFNMPFAETIHVGLVTQSPYGKGTTATFEDFSIENITVSNIRQGQ